MWPGCTYMWPLADMMLSDSSCQLQVLENMKTSKPGAGTAIINIYKYDPDEDICPLSTLKEYLKQTQSLCGDEDKLFIRNLTTQYLETQSLAGLNNS